jgi:hypothetical protein
MNSNCPYLYDLTRSDVPNKPIRVVMLYKENDVSSDIWDFMWRVINDIGEEMFSS